MAKLLAKKRDSLPKNDFALPRERKLPIHDDTHIRLAWDMVNRTQGIDESQREAARKNILVAAHSHGIDTKDWDKKETKKSQAETLYKKHEK